MAMPAERKPVVPPAARPAASRLAALIVDATSSGGADAADLLGGTSVHSELTRGQQIIGLGGAVVGIGVGLWGATRRRTPAPEVAP